MTVFSVGTVLPAAGDRGYSILKTVCFLIKVIIGHVVKELVINPVNGMNELVPALLPVLCRDKFINATAENLECYVSEEGCCSKTMSSPEKVYHEMLRTHYNDSKPGVK